VASGEARDPLSQGPHRRPPRDAKKEIRERERSERTRYVKVYGIDVRDTSHFDLVVDSSDKTPDDIVSILAERMAKWEK
jgi:cytidylate kinase